MKWILIIVASLFALPSFSAELTQEQKGMIWSGDKCCYSQEVLDSVIRHPIDTYQKDTIQLKLPPFKEPASRLTWTVFIGLQVLDVYSTNTALKYSCVEEVNPIFGKTPKAADLVLIKTLVMTPTIYFAEKDEMITNRDLARLNFFLTTIVAHNFNIKSEARDRKCSRR